MTQTFTQRDFRTEEQWSDFRGIIRKCIKSEYITITDDEVITNIPEWDFDSTNRLDGIIDACKE